MTRGGRRNLGLLLAGALAGVLAVGCGESDEGAEAPAGARDAAPAAAGTGDRSSDAPPADPDTAIVGGTSGEREPVPVVRLSRACPDDLAADPFLLRELGVDGDFLELELTFSGGCQRHELTVCWDGRFLESFPVQAPVRIHHDANGDACDAFVTAPLRVDLRPLRESFVPGDPSASGEVVVRIDGTEQQVSYRF